MTEDSFFARLFARMPPPGNEVIVPPGDDCAAIRWRPGSLQLLAVDQVVGERHYRSHGPQADPPALAGRKLLARNLSDIAAMGGKPLYCLLAAAFPRELPLPWMEAFYDGILDCARDFQVAMIGGDFSSTPADQVASLTIIGEVDDDKVLTRAAARPGQLLYMTGECGNSFASGHHLRFTPRCAEGQWLAEHRLAAAMIDISDGLLLDAARIADASACGMQFDLPALPRRTPETSIAQALGDGEDFELLFTVPPDRAAELDRLWPFATRLTRIGRVLADCHLLDHHGQTLDRRGWDHFTPAP